jgi:hypothetical protein
MTELVVNDTRALIQYLADGVQASFVYPFPVLAAEHLAVVLDDGSTPTGLTVSGVGDSAGGTVAFAAPPAAGRLVTLYRDMPLERSTDFQQAGEFRAAAINAELDRLALMIQQIETLASAALRPPPGDADLSPLLPDAAARAQRILSFDADGRPTAAEAPTAAAARAVDAADAAETAQAAAAGSVTAADDAKTAAEAAADAADQSAGTAATDAAAAADAAQSAAAWAETAEDVEVAPGQYSARHWAAKATAADPAAERRRSDRVAIRAGLAARVPGAALLPDWAFDIPLGAGLDEFSVARTGPAFVTDRSGALAAVPADTPRIDHDPATGAVAGLLLEGARSNLLHDSFQPATQTRTLAAGTYTLSVHGAGSVALSGGPTGTATAGAPTSFTLAASTAVTFTVAGAPDAIQCEAGASATSPIQTPAGASAARAAEILSAVDTAWLNPDGTSFVIDARLADPAASGTQRLFSLDDGTDANRHEVYWNGAMARIYMFAKAGGASQGNLVGLSAGWADGATQRIGFTLGGGQRSLFANGAKAGDGSLTEPSGAANLRIGVNVQSSFWNGHVLRVAAYARRLSDADMIALTA